MANNCNDNTKDFRCNPFQLTRTKDQQLIDRYVNEHTSIGGADLNVYKLLGVHEQTRLVDLTGNGNPISGGDAADCYKADNAFTQLNTQWRSLQTGSGVTTSAYIGYDFGEIKLDNGRQKYGIDTSVRHNVSTIKIKQSSEQNLRVTKARVERSDDGVTWYGVRVVMLPDDDNLNTVHFRSSVPSRYWRLRPIEFNGGSKDFWAVYALELIDHEVTGIGNVQDKLFMENRSRDYTNEPLLIKGYYDLLDVQTELTRFGIELPAQQFYITVNFSASTMVLGRPFVIGDVIEVPSETQYNPDMDPIRKYLEITDVAWSTEGYTPGWQPTMLRLIAQPMYASQETQDIVGDLSKDVDPTGLVDVDDGDHPIYQDLSEYDHYVKNRADSEVPERGQNTEAEIQWMSEEQLQQAEQQGVNLRPYTLNPTGFYVENALPPNGEDYTEGDEFPENPSDKDYHRLTYTNIDPDIPPRLYRYSDQKQQWLYLETDRRFQYDGTMPILHEYINKGNSGDN